MGFANTAAKNVGLLIRNCNSIGPLVQTMRHDVREILFMWCRSGKAQRRYCVRQSSARNLWWKNIRFIGTKLRIFRANVFPTHPTLCLDTGLWQEIYEVTKKSSKNNFPFPTISSSLPRSLALARNSSYFWKGMTGSGSSLRYSFSREATVCTSVLLWRYKMVITLGLKWANGIMFLNRSNHFFKMFLKV